MDAASAIIDTEPTTILSATARLRYVAKHENAATPSILSTMTSTR
jgi:hypothetical protein